MNRRTRTRRTLAALLAGCLIAAACGSDGDEVTESTEAPAEAEASEESAEESGEESAEESGEESAEESGEESAEEVAAPSGDPIKILATGTIESPVFSLPNIPIGAQIAVDEINAAGGVNGRPLELIVCNDELDPNVAASCVQQAIDEEVVALVSGLSVFEPLVIPQLVDADIPWIGMAIGSDFSSPVLFPLASDGASAFSSIGFAAVDQAGCATPAVFISSQGSPDNTAHISAGITAAGGTVSSTQQGQGPDFAPLVEAALADGADCIASGVSPPESAGLVTAIAGRVPLITLDGPFPEPLAASLGDAVDGVVLTSGWNLPASGDPAIVALAEKTAEMFPDSYIDNHWINGYVGVNIVAEVLDGSDDMSAAAVLAGVPTLTAYDTGFGPVIDFSTPNSAAGFERIFNTEMRFWEVQGGAYSAVEGVTFDMQPALEILSQG